MQKLTIVFLLTFTGCLSAYYTVDSSYDQFNETEIVRMKNNVLPNSGFQASVSFNIMKIKLLEQDTTRYVLEIIYNHSDWLFIKDGCSISIIADTDKFELCSISESRDVLGSGRVKERVVYSINKNQIGVLSGSASIEFRLSGSDYYSDRRLSKRNIENISSFYTNYVSQ